MLGSKIALLHSSSFPVSVKQMITSKSQAGFQALNQTVAGQLNPGSLPLPIFIIEGACTL